MPGLAKTLAIKTLSQLISSDYSRIQFTPDVHAYVWTDGGGEYAGGWPGVACTKTGEKIYTYGCSFHR